jgi:hypothetical protein
MSSLAFPDTDIVVEGGSFRGPARQPRQMLAEQSYDGHASVHDESVAGDLGLSGAPIEGPTHFSQFDPLAAELWGDRWFADGCISSHFQTMVVEGETVTAVAERIGDDIARIDAAKADGTPVLTGTISVGTADPTELDQRLAKMRERDPGDLFIVDQIEVGATTAVDRPVQVDADTPNGHLYPFSLAQKLAAITERSPWYDSTDTPWGRPVLPFEMYSVLTNQVGSALPVRGPAIGLFVDLQVRAHGQPLFVGHDYLLEREVLAVGQSRKVESHWVNTTVRDAATGDVCASVLLHSGVFKASYAGYPADRL